MYVGIILAHMFGSPLLCFEKLQGQRGDIQEGNECLRVKMGQ